MKDISADDLEKKLLLVSKKSEFHQSEIIIPNANDYVVIGGKDIVVIGGPCAVESFNQIMEIARNAKESGAKMLRGGVFKPLTFPYSNNLDYIDVGNDYDLAVERLEMLANAGKVYDLPVVTEVMHVKYVELVANYADVLQIGARNMQNVELLLEVGKIEKPVLLKRHPGMSLRDFLGAAEWIYSKGNYRIILCERGVSAPHTHCINSRFLPDIAAIPYLKKYTHLPVIFDPSHSTFNRLIVAPMAKAAIAAGADGILVDVHPTPEKAAIDPLQALDFKSFRQLVIDLDKIAGIVR